jgi:catechol 2,3-dioxygenase-like lactoylglutathione lyase family enzyme
MKLRTGDPWMSAPAYSQTLSGLGVNLLVRDIAACTRFQVAVLGADVVYADPDFAVYRAYGAEWMAHADHSYDHHPLGQMLAAAKTAERGVGAELRVHGCDPERAEAKARELGYKVVAPTAVKGHGLREVYILDADGYLWVPDVLAPAP